MGLKSIQIQKQGVKKSLGDLEAQIMKVLWKSTTPITAREITDNINKEKKISFNAVSTVLKRLDEKKLIIKKAHGKRYSFLPAIKQKEFAQNIFKTTLSSLFNDSSLLSAAGFSGNESSNFLDKDVIASLEKFISQQKNDE